MVHTKPVPLYTVPVEQSLLPSSNNGDHNMTDLCSTELQVNSSTASVIPENSSNDNKSKGTDTRSFIEGGTDTTGYNGLEYDYHFTFSKSLISQLHSLFSTKPELLQF